MDIQKEGELSNLDKMIHSRLENPYGITWEDWTVNWWKWVLSLPRDINPGLDMSGDKFQCNKENPEVLYMVGTYGGFANRSALFRTINPFLSLLSIFVFLLRGA